jgi:hypothetical protein
MAMPTLARPRRRVIDAVAILGDDFAVSPHFHDDALLVLRQEFGTCLHAEGFGNRCGGTPVVRGEHNCRHAETFQGFNTCTSSRGSSRIAIAPASWSRTSSTDTVLPSPFDENADQFSLENSF